MSATPEQIVQKYAADIETICRETHIGRQWAPSIARELQPLADLIRAAQEAKSHVAELRAAWQIGAIGEYDCQGGTRSNRNADVDNLLFAALEKLGSI